MIKVEKLKKLGGYRLRVHFSDGSFGDHDFSAMVAENGSMLQLLRDEACFARVFLEFGALTWPNGFDIAPEWLPRDGSSRRASTRRGLIELRVEDAGIFRGSEARCVDC